jgi:type IV pilus assembly protein PilY1
MNLPTPTLVSAARWILLATSFVAAVASNAVTIPNSPLSVQSSAKPMIMLAMGKDHRMFYEAYNDASDIDGDGTLDIRFKPKILYLGLFDSNVCYTHNNLSDGTGLFTPSSTASGTLKTCSGKWSGNWLNYVTTSRIDALRVVLYGGTREVDTTSSTVLRRAYIPQDAHSWAKEYTSSVVDGFDINKYTPLSQPTAGNRHFFGNLTPNVSTNCATLNNCSESLHPWLSVVLNSNKRVWEWASKERPVLDGSHGGARIDRTVRVEVCTATFKTGCKQYSNGKNKPVGLLHDFGENESTLFGLLSGSYDKNFSGGRLRKVVSSFKNEVDQTTGQFITGTATIVKTIDKLRIRDFNNGSTDGTYRGGFGNVTTIVKEGEHVDWGNPIGEIMYEATRYFAGKGAPTAAFAGATTMDDQIGLPAATWDGPYTATSAAKAPWCARANLLTISDTNISFDSDQLPGVNANFGIGIASDLSGKNIINGSTTNLDVANIAKFITDHESGIIGRKFIGQSGAVYDSAPTPKNVTSLGDVRGLAPEEATKQGSYYAASVAHYAKVNDLQPSLKGNQTIDNFFVALASPLPRIEAKLPNGNVMTLVPFAKSVSGGSPAISNIKGNFQPTNQIVDFYVESIDNDNPKLPANMSVNGGRYQAKFRINFEDVEQGADHDMDAIVQYTVKANADSTLDVQLETIYEAGGIQHRMGYIISGSTNDGIHLVVQDESDQTPYFLNVPPGRSPGYCDKATVPADCKRLPYYKAVAPDTSISNAKFTPSTTSAATFLKDPMWYAAKYGGFVDDSDNPTGLPDDVSKWDKDGDGVPDTYFFVQNPTKLKQSLKDAFESIVRRNSSSSNVVSNSSQLDSNSQIYQADFESGKWIGDVKSYSITKNGIGTAPLWSARKSLPLWSDRNIYMHTSAGAVVNTKNTAFSALPSSVQTNFSSTVDIYNYIRGDASKEIAKGGGFRNRETPLGDIIHSSPNLDPDSGVFYVGANDGMLHAFNNVSGTETFAFIPGQNQSKLKNLAATNYDTNHNYFVDGDVELGFKTAVTNNTKYLYSLLGRGGKGLFSLNISGTAPNLRWEYTPDGSTSVIPTDAATDKDLGLMIGRPVFAKMNNGKAALLVGNGYNSTDGKAVLYIFILNSDGTLYEVKKLDTGIGGDNGLAGPAFIDTDNDGDADTIFAGDLKGNLWKFDVSNSDASLWSIAYGNKPLFKAVNDLNETQPITAPLYIVKNSVTGVPNSGSYYIFFGTGSYFQTGDANDQKVQSWYGIVDGATEIAARTDLRKRTISTIASVGSSEVRVFSAATNGDMTGKRGWYLDLVDGKYPGERIVTRSRVIPAAKPALLVTSLFPITNDVCVPGGDGFVNLIDPFTGGGIQLDLIDVDNNKKFDAADRVTGQFASSIKTNVGIPTTPIFIPSGGNNSGGSSGPLNLTTGENKRYYDGNGNDVTGKEKDCSGSGQIAYGGSDGRGSLGVACGAGGSLRGRISWREILKD